MLEPEDYSNLDELKNLEEEFEREIGDKPYLGTLDTSVRLQAVGDRREPYGATEAEAELYFDNLELLACFRSISVEDLEEINSGGGYENFNSVSSVRDDEGNKLNILKEFKRRNRFQNLDVEAEFHYLPLDVRDFEGIRSEVARIGREISENTEYKLTKLGFDGIAEDDSAVEAYESFCSSLGFYITFVYEEETDNFGQSFDIPLDKEIDSGVWTLGVMGEGEMELTSSISEDDESGRKLKV